MCTLCASSAHILCVYIAFSIMKDVCVFHIMWFMIWKTHTSSLQKMQYTHINITENILFETSGIAKYEGTIKECEDVKMKVYKRKNTFAVKKMTKSIKIERVNQKANNMQLPQKLKV